MFECLTLSQFPQTFLTDPSKLKIYLCKISVNKPLGMHNTINTPSIYLKLSSKRSRNSSDSSPCSSRWNNKAQTLRLRLSKKMVSVL